MRPYHYLQLRLAPGDGIIPLREGAGNRLKIAPLSFNVARHLVSTKRQRRRGEP
jgi:hypothetical protein